MIFESKIIKGLGKGKELGYPTVNLEIPKDFKYEFGIYKGFIWFGEKKKLSAVFFGHRVTMGVMGETLEFYVIDWEKGDEKEVSEAKKVKFEIGNFIRESRKFESEEELKKQIEEDVERVRTFI